MALPRKEKTVHQDPASAQHIAQTDTPLVFLPPYSPDLNPLELVFATRKALARGGHADSRHALDLSGDRRGPLLPARMSALLPPLWRHIMVNRARSPASVTR